jgi:hypothetical protein
LPSARFRADPGHPAINYVAPLHADLSGRDLENQAKGTRLAQDTQYVEAVLKIFDPDYNVAFVGHCRRAYPVSGT